MTYPDNIGDSDRWQDPRDIQGGETDQPAPTPRTDAVGQSAFVPRKCTCHPADWSGECEKRYALNECRIAKLERELSAARAEVERMRQALIEAKRQACTMRVWGGMGWSYHPPQAKRIHDVCESALAATRKEEGNG